MNRSLLALIMVVSLVASSGAASDPAVNPEADTTLQQPSDINTDVDSAASPIEARSDLGQRIRTEVLESITRAIEEDPDISDIDKQAFEQAIENGSHKINMDFDIDEDDSAGELMLGGLAILLIFGTPIMLVAAFLYAGHRKRRLASDMAGQFLASGQPVPPEVWQGLAGDNTPRSNLHKGMVMLGVGLGIFLCFWLIGSMEAAYLGLIPLFIGIAQLLIWKLENRKAGPEE